MSIRKNVDGLVTALALSGPLSGKRPERLNRAFKGAEGHCVVDLWNISDTELEGITALHNALGEARCLTVSLARVPTQFITCLGTSGQDPGGKITSVIATTQPEGPGCRFCRSPGGTELDARAVHDIDAGRTRCPECGTELTLLGDADWITAAKERMSDPPSEVKLYLQRSHPGIELPDNGAEPEILEGRKYQQIGRLGAGGMAEVFLAEQRGPQGFRKRVVLKRILPVFAEDLAFVEMFLREARIAARISHPNVAQIFDLGKSEGKYYIAMEYIEGWDLRRIMRVTQYLGTQIPLPIACRMAADACAGLHAAHRAKDHEGTPLHIVHRDVSPSNILVSATGVVKVVDFGVARAREAAQATTEDGRLKGKTNYAAPEQISGEHEKISPATDLFAMGIVLYEMLTGAHPFERPSEYRMMTAIMEEDAPQASSKRAGLPATLDKTIAKALAKAPVERWQEASDLQMALEQVLVELGAPATLSHVSEWLDNLATRYQLEAPEDDLQVGQLQTGPRSRSNSFKPMKSASPAGAADAHAIPRESE